MYIRRIRVTRMFMVPNSRRIQVRENDANARVADSCLHHTLVIIDASSSTFASSQRRHRKAHASPHIACACRSAHISSISDESDIDAILVVERDNARHSAQHRRHHVVVRPCAECARAPCRRQRRRRRCDDERRRRRHRVGDGERASATGNSDAARDVIASDARDVIASDKQRIIDAIDVVVVAVGRPAAARTRRPDQPPSSETSVGRHRR
jgi:hypothetical protein